MLYRIPELKMNLLKYSSLTGGCAVICLAVMPGSPAKEKHAPKKPVPTFSKDVAPILYSKCSPCHHQGEVAPFNLMSYEDARAKAPTLAAAVSQKYMPPWQAVSHGEFANDRTLTPAQIQTLNDWAAGGAPKGDLAKAPKPPTYTPGWGMGLPDMVAKPPAAYQVGAEGADEYRCFVIPSSFTADRYVTSIEVKPGNRHVVHHVIIYLDKSGVARKKDGKDGKPGYVSFGGPGFVPAGTLGGWAPGLQYQTLPAGDAILLPKGADIVIQVHYHKDGKAEEDQTQVGLKFATGPVDKSVRWESVDNELISIKPGEKRYEVKADVDLPADVTLLDVIPHMHLLGHDMTVTATLPTGEKKELIHVEPYDFNWQTRYAYKQPVHLPKGTHLDLVAHYDNSSDNPHNPNNPPKKVVFGEQTTNEMCFAFFSYTFDDEHITKGQYGTDMKGLMSSHRELTINKIFDHFDANHDGYLDVTELSDVIDFFQSALEDPTKAKQDPTKQAKMALAFFAKTDKTKMSRDEFAKMTRSIK